MTNTTLASDVINVADLKSMLVGDPNLKILDVRTGGEFESSHIAGSYNVPLDTLGEHVKDLADVGHPVVLVCQSGGRATQAHGALRDAGKLHIHILEGGMNAWTSADGDLVVGETERWAMDRQVRFTAGSMVIAAVVGSLVAPKAKWLAAGVGGGLFYSAVSNTCAMAKVLSKLPYNKTDNCDIPGVLAGLRETA